MDGRRVTKRSVTSRPKSASNVLHSIHVPGAKHYKIKKDGQVYIFSGITPKQFKERPNAKVVGYFTNKTNKDASPVGRLFELRKSIRGVTSTQEYEVYNTSRKLRHAVAYVPVGNDEYLVYEKFNKALLSIPTAAALAMVIGLWANAGKLPVNPLGLATTVDIGGSPDKEVGEDEMIDFAGYDEVNVNADSPYMYLQNPESNDVYFSYVISDDSGREYITTDLIPPGKALQWDAKSALGSGNHVINMHVDTYDMEDTAIPYNAMNYDKVKVSVN